MSEQWGDMLLSGTAAEREAQARALAARMKAAARSDGKNPEELSDDALWNITGGAEGEFKVGERVYVDGKGYLDRSENHFSCPVKGYYEIYLYLPGGPICYLLKGIFVWVNAKSIQRMS